MNDPHTPDTWSPEDDAFVRGALLSLRDDVLATPLQDPAFVRARGNTGNRRRMLALTAAVAAAVVIVGALGFRGLARGDATPPPLPGTPTPSLTPEDTPTATSTASPTASPSATPSATGTASPDPTAARPSSTPQSTPSVVAPPSTPSPTGTFDCPARARTVDTTGVADAAARTARALMAGAAACDEDALVARFEADGTRMSFGAGSVSEMLSLPDNVDRYTTLTTILAMPPGEEGAEGYVQWPKPPETDSEWQRIIDSGLYSQADVEAMKEFGGYTGWRVVMVAATGQVTAYLAGD